MVCSFPLKMISVRQTVRGHVHCDLNYLTVVDTSSQLLICITSLCVFTTTVTAKLYILFYYALAIQQQQTSFDLLGFGCFSYNISELSGYGVL